jgi:hypothetical protein
MNGKGESSETFSSAEKADASGACPLIIRSISECNSAEHCDSICISSQVRFLGPEWSNNNTIKRITFEVGSELREICETTFELWHALVSICFPPSMRKISGLNKCFRLSEVYFGPNSGLIEIGGFIKCTSLSRLEIPPSVEKIDKHAFAKCSEL